MLPVMSDASDPGVRGFAVVTISSTRTAQNDESGSIARDALAAAGHHLVHQRWIGNDLSTIRYQMREWVDDPRVQVIVAIGGSGLDSNDITCEAMAPLITKGMPGFGEMLRMLMFQELGIAALETRSLGAVCHATLVYLVPGAPAAVNLAVNRLIVPMLKSFVPAQHFSPQMAAAIRLPPGAPK